MILKEVHKELKEFLNKEFPKADQLFATLTVNIGSEGQQSISTYVSVSTRKPRTEFKFSDSDESYSILLEKLKFSIKMFKKERIQEKVKI